MKTEGPRGGVHIDPKLLLLAKRFVEFNDENPLFTFRMNPMQDRFFDCDAEIRLLCAGNQSGKTTCGIAEDIAFLLGYRPWLTPGHPKFLTEIPPPVKIRMIVKDYDIAVKENIIPVFEELVPNLTKREDFETDKHYGTGAINKIIHKPTGSKLHIISHKQEGKAEGGTCHVVHVDEPCPEKIWRASRRALITKSGRAWFTLTPVKDSIEDAKYIGWIYDSLYSRADGKRIAVVKGSSYDNVGFGATEQQMKDWELDQPDSDSVRTRVHGEFSHLTGVVYKTFHPSINNLQPKEFPSIKGWTRYVGIDPHPEKGHFAVFHAVNPDEDIYVYDVFHAGTVKEFAIGMIAREPMLGDDFGSRMSTLIVDPSYMEKGGWVSGNSFADELRKWGIKASIFAGIHQPGSVSQGIQIVQNYQSDRRVWYHEEKCKPLFHEFLRYIWGPGGRPIKKCDDYCDAHRMVLQYGPRYYALAKSEKRVYGRGRRGRAPGNTWEQFGFGM